MKKSFYLSVLRDQDLIVLYKSDTALFTGGLKKAIRAYMEGRSYTIEKDFPVIQECRYKESKNIFFHLVLSDDKDADIISFFNGIKPRMQNQFIKNLMRASLKRPVLYSYFRDYDAAVIRESQIDITYSNRDSKQAVEKEIKNPDKFLNKSQDNREYIKETIIQDNTSKIKTDKLDDNTSKDKSDPEKDLHDLTQKSQIQKNSDDTIENSSIDTTEFKEKETKDTGQLENDIMNMFDGFMDSF